MCQYSATAENMRDARRGEDLVITPAPHGSGNWLTETGNPGCAVCIPDTAVLAVQLLGQAARGASFKQYPGKNMFENGDYLEYVDGEMERVALNDLPEGTKVRVLQLFYNGIGEPDVSLDEIDEFGADIAAIAERQQQEAAFATAGMS